MKFNSIFLSSLLTLCVSQVAISASVETTKPENPERWFEIEVILFKQLNNKATLKEQFPDGINSSSLPSYRQSFDLLNPYLQPNLTRIKSFIPLCGEKDEQQIFLESLQSVTPPFPEEIKLIEQVALFTMPDFTQETAQEVTLEDNQALNIASNTVEGVIEDNNADESYINENELNAKEPVTTQGLITNSNEESTNTIEQVEVEAFEFDLQKDTLAKPIFSTQSVCIITQNEMESLLTEEELTDFNLDSFGVNALPSKLNASGAHISDSPYLIADESLLLKDINQRLRWSKEFKPLLHFGWRQVGIALPKKAIPLKLFAGEHLEYRYQQALTDYQIETEEAKAIEKNLLEQIAKSQATSQLLNNTISQESEADDAILLSNEFTDSTSIVSVDNSLKIKTDQKQQALNQLFSRIEYINNNPIDNNELDNIINNTNEQNLENILSSKFVPTNDEEIIIEDNLLDISKRPKIPLQPWSLDGFLKVYLDGRYLFITADFNVFNQQLKEIESNEINKVKLINFSQNRRVISGEIHYFDHPYIGMIVQIRRFDPTKPVGEQVTQAIK